MHARTVAVATTVALGLVLAQAAPAHAQRTAPWLDSLVTSLPTYRQHVAARPAEFELQVLYRALDGPDSNVTYGYGLAPARYFYPASTVKLPVAALALQHLSELGILGLTSDSPMEVGASEAHEFLPYLEPDASAPHVERVGMPDTPATVMGHVRDIAIVSSNEAYNRLYEWLGPRYIQEAFAERGWTARVIARLGAPGYDALANRLLNPVAFRHRDPARADTVYFRGQAFQSVAELEGIEGQVKGRGYYDDARQEVIRRPFDFTAKNFIPLADLAACLQAVVAPETVDPPQRFRMAELDRAELAYALRTPPRDSDNPLHRDKPDGYVNFLYYGGDGDWEQGGPRIHNKVGDAYGYLTDVAVFENPYTGHRFVLAATVHVNANGVYNDGVYEYEEIGLPLLRELGRAVYELSD